MAARWVHVVTLERQAFAGLVLLFAVLALHRAGWKFAFGAFWEPAFGATFFVGVLVWAYDKWLWSWWPATWIVKRPDLNGTWKGTFEPITTNKRAGAGQRDAYYVVTQTRHTLVMRLLTAESTSVTLTCDVCTEPDERKVVYGVFRNEPALKERAKSAIHEGAFRLVVSGDDDEFLTGSYWNDRDSKGELKFRRIGRERAKDYEQATRLPIDA